MEEYINKDLFEILAQEDWREILDGLGFVVKDLRGMTIINYRLSQTNMMSKAVQEGRGIIIDSETREVLCRPFPKFWNWGEPKDDFDETKTPLYYQPKVDGSLIKIWRHPDGEIYISTNGVIDAYLAEVGRQELSIETLSFGELVDKALGEHIHLLDKVEVGDTHLFELTTPDNMVVVPHEEYTMVYLGMRKVTGEQFIPTPGDLFSEAFGNMETKELKYSLDVLKARAEEEAQEKLIEGYVVMNSIGQRVKIKTDTYLSLHRAVSPENRWTSLYEIIKLGDEEELLTYLPELGDTLEQVKGYINDMYNQSLHYASKLIGLTRKEAFVTISKDEELGPTHSRVVKFLMSAHFNGKEAKITRDSFLVEFINQEEELNTIGKMEELGYRKDYEYEDSNTTNWTSSIWEIIVC